MRASFQGKAVLLTGAGSGIGRACALELARRGARLGLVDINAASLDETASQVRALGVEVFPFTADLSREEAVERVAKEVEAAFGPLDVLFSNAGVAVVKPAVLTSEMDWDWILGVNVRAPIRLVRALVPSMVARGRGQIVLTASLAGLVGAPGMVAYSTTKFALVGFAESLRLELADAGVRVTAVCPGYVRTNLHKATRYANDGFERFLDSAPPWYGVSAARAAQIIVDGVARGRPQIVFGPEKAGWWLKRASPAVGFAVARWAARRMGILAAN
jgi:NAD(P)-dependent dehydrogenase (short-subunit alcohol dehydrogenase family)